MYEEPWNPIWIKMKNNLLFLLLLISTICWGQDTVVRTFKIRKVQPKIIADTLKRPIIKESIEKSYGHPYKTYPGKWSLFIRKIIPDIPPPEAKDPKTFKRLKKVNKLYTYYNNKGMITEEWAYDSYPIQEELINNQKVNSTKAPYAFFWFYDTLGNLIKQENWRCESQEQYETKNKELIGSTFYFYKNNLLQKSFSPSFTYSITPSVGSISPAKTSTYIYDNLGNLIMRKDSSISDSDKSYGISIYKYDNQRNLIIKVDSFHHTKPNRLYYSTTTFKYDSLNRIATEQHVSLFTGNTHIGTWTYFYKGNTKQLKEALWASDNNERTVETYNKYGYIKKPKWYSGNKLIGYNKYYYKYY